MDTDIEQAADAQYRVPDLIFENPDCSLCLENAHMAGDGTSFWCEKCGSTWDADGRGGTRQDGEG